MAGDWIKVRPSLVSSPKVRGIVKYIKSNPEVSKVLAPDFDGNIGDIVTRNVMCNVTVTLLVTIWGAANEHTSDGTFKNFDYSDIDDIAGVPGFAKAMESVGWLIHDPVSHTITLPNFSEYNTCDSERDKKNNRERQRRHREKMKERNAKNNVTRNVTCNDRIEERREEDIKEKEQKKEELPEDLIEFVRHWNQIGGDIPKVQRITKPLIKKWQAAKKKADVREALENPETIVANIKASPFLMGESDWGGVYFQWLFNSRSDENNAVKVYQGRYNGKGISNGTKPRSPSRVDDADSRDGLRFLRES